MRSYPATIHREGGPTGEYDGYGNPIYSEPRDIEARVYRVRRKSSTELDQGRQTLVVTVEAAFKAGTDLRETDEVTIGGSEGTRYGVAGLYAETQALGYVHADLSFTS